MASQPREIRISVTAVKDVVDGQGLVDYLTGHIKAGRHMPAGRLDGINIALDKDAALITSSVAAPKRYYKYLAKRFLHKAGLTEYVRPQATKTGYDLVFIQTGEEEEAED